jgi:hypothetical protein
MKTDRILTIVGIFLTLPGFIAMFFTKDWSLPAMTMLLGLVVLIASLLVRIFVTLPPFTVISHIVTVDFLDDYGRQARMRKEYVIRPNYGHLSSITFRNIAGDGRISKIAWNDEELPAEAVKRRMEEYVVTVTFHHTLPRWKEIRGVLSYEAADTFPERNEGMIYTPDFPTKTATLRVVFPANRKFKSDSVGASKIEGTGETRLKPPEISGDQKTIEVTLRRTRPGEEYSLFWEW